jgi:D-beta-D-heptose 7-phosphate kinase/D-beta-D-heptose 1-phosphate adenosyltransferase
MKDIDSGVLRNIITRFKDKKVLVIGDLMLDKYIWGNVARISPEAPVPVVEVKKDTSCLGGAGNVSHNLEALGAVPLPVGMVGDDPEGDWIKKKFAKSQGVIVSPQRPTTVKTRIIAHHQQVVRVDHEKRSPVLESDEKQMFDFIQTEQYEGIVISDYNKGILTQSLMSRVLPFAEKRKIPVFVDPKAENLQMFSPVSLITPNHHEAGVIARQVCDSDAQVEKAGQRIMETIRSQYLFIKRGEKGLTVFETGKKAVHIPAKAKEVFDVTGAGDTVIAVSSLALLAGATIEQAAFLANMSAGVVVGKIGTATLSSQELIQAI